MRERENRRSGKKKTCYKFNEKKPNKVNILFIILLKKLYVFTNKENKRFNVFKINSFNFILQALNNKGNQSGSCSNKLV